MTPQELKNSILQMAIQGKLVEQRPEEGTSEELFARIQEEKQQLIKEKKIKKEKPLPEVREEENPFDIPESWKWIRVGNCGSWGSGATPTRTNAEYYGGTIPWLKTGDLNDDIIMKIPEYITELALEKTSVRLNPVGSILMAMYGATIGKLGILGIEATTNQACCACIPYEGIYNKYLFYFLMASRTVFIKMGEGGAQPNISKEKIVNALIPLPPLAEQKRIVAKIEELLPYIDRYEQAWCKLEKFNSRFPEDMKKSLLQYAIQGKLVEQRHEEGTAEELFEQIQEEKQQLFDEKKYKKKKLLTEINEDTPPFDIPENWKWVYLVDIIEEKPSNGYSPKGVTYPTKIRNLTLTATTSGKFKEDAFKYVDISEIEASKYWLKNNDLLIQRSNSRELVGTSCIYTGGDKEYIYPDLMMRLRVVNGISTKYIDYVLKSPMTRNYYMANASGTSESMPKINQKIVSYTLIPLPPLAEQRRIVEKLELLLPLCERLK